MLLVECSNLKEKNTLEQEFEREGNYFAVSIKKTSILSDLINGLSYQYFSEEIENKTTKKPKQKLQNKSQLCEAILKIIEDSLKMKVSFSNIRKVFDLLKEKEEQIKLYQSHIIKLNSIIMADDEGNQNFMQSNNSLENLNDLFDHVLNPSKSKITTLYNELNAVDDEGKMMDKILNQKQIFSARSDTSIISSQLADSRKNNLKIQIPSSPKGFQTNYKDLESQEGQSQLQSTLITRVQDQCALDNTTNSTFYCPTWKKIENQKKKQISSLFNSALEIKLQTGRVSENSEYADDLSTQIIPLPSILTDESIGDLMKKEKKEEIKKSNIIKESIAGTAKLYSQEKLYDERIRMMKLNTKFRKGKGTSKKKVSIQEDNFLQDSRKQIKKQPKKQVIGKEIKHDSDKKNKQDLGMFFRFKKACFGN